MNDLKYILFPILVVILSQSIKSIILFIKTKEFSIYNLTCMMGGSPSTHSSFVSAITTLIFLDYGICPLFGTALVFSLIVITDAMGIRYESERQAKLINKILNTNLNENLGHEPYEVLTGVLFGIITTVILNLLI